MSTCQKPDADCGNRAAFQQENVLMDGQPVRLCPDHALDMSFELQTEEGFSALPGEMVDGMPPMEWFEAMTME